MCPKWWLQWQLQLQLQLQQQQEQEQEQQEQEQVEIEIEIEIEMATINTGQSKMIRTGCRSRRRLNARKRSRQPWNASTRSSSRKRSTPPLAVSQSDRPASTRSSRGGSVRHSCHCGSPRRVDLVAVRPSPKRHSGRHMMSSTRARSARSCLRDPRMACPCRCSA
jgi:hypothetical protein